MADKDDNDQLPPLGEGTEKFLDDVYKGKPRNFLMICKGPKVTFLSVRKKPIKPGEVAAAKKEGYKGDAYFGTVSGKGIALVFHLSKAEYQSVPVKDLVLKEFLDEHAELKVRPTIELVDELPPIPFDEDDLQHPLIARFLKLEAVIVAVLDKQPQAAQELQQRVTQIRELLQAEDFVGAGPKIDDLVALLRESSQAPTPAPSPQATTAPTPAPTPAPDNEATRAMLKASLDRLVPRYDDAVRRMPGNTVQMRAVMGFVRETLETGDFTAFAKGLERLAKMVDEALSGAAGKATDVIPENIVADRKKVLEIRWQDAVRRVHAEIDKLRDAIALNNPDEGDPDELPDEITASIDEFLDDFNDALIGVGKSSGDDRKPVERVLQSIRDYREQIGSNDLIQHLNDATIDLDVSVDVEAVLRAALDEIEAKLA